MGIFQSPAIIAWQQAHTLAQQAKFAEAISLYQQALALKPHLSAWRGLGDALYAMERYEEAITAYDQAIALNPGALQRSETVVHVRRILTLIELKRLDAALGATETLLAQAPRNSDLWVCHGLAYARMKRLDDAEESLLTAVELAPTSRFALANLRTFYCKDLRDFDQAMDVCVRLLSHWPQNETSWGGKGAILHNSGRYQEAVDSYERALECKAESVLTRALTWCNYGLSLIHLGRCLDALVAFDRSEALRPSRMSLLNGRGAMHFRIEQHGKALEFFEDAIHAAPDDATPRLNKAESLTYLERYDEAESILNEAQAIEPESVDGWSVRGLLAARRERHDEAMSAFSKAIELKPYHGQAYVELATFLLALRDAEHACQFAERATSLDSFLARAWKVKGQALRAAGRENEAAEAERRGAALLADQRAQVDAYLAAQEQGEHRTE